MKPKEEKGSREDIRVINKYRRGPKKIWRASAYDGVNLVDPRDNKITKHVVSKSLRTSDPQKADGLIAKWVEQLQHNWDVRFADGKPSGRSEATSGSQPSLEQDVEAVLQQLMMELGPGNTYRGYAYPARKFLALLGEFARVPSDRHTGPEFSRVVEEFVEDLDPTTDSIGQTLNRARHVFSRIRTLKPECLEAMRHGPKQPGKTAGHSFWNRDVIAMGRHLPQATNTEQACFWLLACCSQHRIDIACSEWDSLFPADAPHRSGRRKKTRVEYNHLVWPELLRVIGRRIRKPGDIYVFPEFVFSKKELKDPRCNKRRLSSAELKRRALEISVKMGEAFNSFLKGSGVKREGISIKSFRCFNARVGLASNQSYRVLMDALGIRELKTLLRYAGSTEEEVQAQSEFFRQHWLAIMKGRKVTWITCLTQAVEILSKLIRAGNHSIRRELRTLSETVSGLREVLNSVLTKLHKPKSGHDSVPLAA